MHSWNSPTEARHHTIYCSELNKMSIPQKELRLRINYITDTTQKATLKQERLILLHALRRRAIEKGSARLNELAAEGDRLHDGTKVFRSVRLLTRKPYVRSSHDI